MFHKNRSGRFREIPVHKVFWRKKRKIMATEDLNKRVKKQINNNKKKNQYNCYNVFCEYGKS